MAGLSVLHSPRGDFSVLLHNRSGAWRIIEGRHDLAALLPLGEGMEKPQAAADYHVITIFLNNSCNLRCDYCRFDTVTHTGSEHGTRDLNAVVDAVLDLCRGDTEVEIHFQGGEPLLRPSDIAFVCERLSTPEVPFIPRFHLTTNGTVWSSRIRDLIREHRIAVTVSIDGPAARHDAHRPFANGGGSFAKVLRTLGKLSDAEIPFGVFCVISDPDEMEATYLYLRDELRLSSFVMAPLEIDGRNSPEALEDYLVRFFEAQLRLLERNIDLYVSGGPLVREHLSVTLLKGKISPAYFSKACGDSPHSSCGSKMHSIERNGDVRPCQNARMVADEGDEYLSACLSRQGICESCEIRAHCSTPLCFSRLEPAVVQGFARGDASARAYVDAACAQLKRREAALFDLIYRRKEDVLAYLAA